VIIAIHQPNYLPWLGYFDKIDQVDLFVFLDHVQFARNDFQHRNRIKTPAGPRWLSVPCVHSGGRTSLLHQRIAYDTPWAEEHWRSLQISYASAPFSADLFERLEPLYRERFDTLADLNIALVMTLADTLKLKCKWQRSSALRLPELHKSELLASICQRLGATEYFSGLGAQSYLDSQVFERVGVRVKWQSFVHPTYEQLWMKQGFVSNLSVVDLLANAGHHSMQVLRLNQSFMPVPNESWRSSAQKPLTGEGQQELERLADARDEVLHGPSRLRAR
jgi:hypothetical protein